MTQYDSAAGMGGGRATGSDDQDRDPEEIRVEIAQTRTEMSGTIDAIQQRLAPEVLTEQAKSVARDATEQAKTAAQDLLQDAVQEVKEAAKEVTAHAVHEVRDAARDVTTGAKDAAWDATIGRAEDAVSTASDTARGVGSMVIDTIKQHPIQAALAGLSLYWLYKNRAGGQTSYGGSYGTGSFQPSGPYRQHTAQAYPIRTGYASQAERNAMTARAGTTGMGAAYGAGSTTGAGASRRGGESGGMIENAGQMASGAASTVTDMASDAASTVTDIASDAASTVTEYASDAASTASHFASSAGETAMDTGSSIVDLVMANPIPAALVGLGLGWLYMNRGSGQPDYRAHSNDHYRYDRPGGFQNGGYRSQGSSSSGSMVGRATEQVGDLASSAQERVGDMADTVQEQVGDMAETVMHQTRRAPGQIQRMIEERPLTAAAVAASLGAAVGFWLPPTQLEHQMMGRANHQVMGRAQEMAHDTIEKVQDVAQEVRTTVTEEARAKGLTV